MKNWIQICVTANKKYEESISSILLEKFPSGLYVNENSDIYSICAYSLDDQEFSLTYNSIKNDIYNLEKEDHNMNLSISTSKLTSDIWENVLRGSFKPLECGKFYITPDWEKYEPNNKIIIKLNPGLAFGSGEHETTYLCLETISELNIKGKSFLDVGCGAGILSIGAKKLHAEKVYAIDIDPIAVKVAKENAEKNDVDINTFEGNSSKIVKGKFDIIVANIFANIIIQMSDDLIASKNKNGIIILSGIEVSQADEVIRCFVKKGLKLTNKKTKNEWVVLIFE